MWSYKYKRAEQPLQSPLVERLEVGRGRRVHALRHKDVHERAPHCGTRTSKRGSGEQQQWRRRVAQASLSCTEGDLARVRRNQQSLAQLHALLCDERLVLLDCTPARAPTASRCVEVADAALREPHLEVGAEGAGAKLQRVFLLPS